MTTALRPVLLTAALFAAGLALRPALAATPYDDWAAGFGLGGNAALPTANPDRDRYTNALEFAFGTNPVVAEANYDNAPELIANGKALSFVYRISALSDGIVRYRVLQSFDTEKWTPAAGTPQLIADDGATRTYALPVPDTGRNVFYQLEAAVPYVGSAASPTGTLALGANVGQGAWTGMPVIASPVLQTQPPPVTEGGTDYDYSRYPVVAGTSQSALTDALVSDYAAFNKRPPLRTWLGWFLWGNGQPPPGISPGIPSTGTLNGPWDYFGYQWPNGQDPATAGKWEPLRLDQQPLYANPLTLHYAWPPGPFGYVAQPLQAFPEGVLGYWRGRTIVRGVNVSQAYPFFYQYGDNSSLTNKPPYWQPSWFFSAMRPVESTIIVPGNLAPDELLEPGPWNANGAQAFPYPVWDKTLGAADQTPWSIQVDRVGQPDAAKVQQGLASDFDADLVWEGTRPGAKNYAANRYVRTPFNQPGKGNYLKMTVAQGSPFVWCETNNSKFVTFYNVIRTNLQGQIDNNTGTGAKTVAGGPFTVPGVTGVKFLLLYGDQTNPNQWHQENAPLYADNTGASPTMAPGGFNPPGQQHNLTYTAVFYRDDQVVATPSGTDKLGNPYGALEFAKAGKNWFVVGSVPVMRYYGVAPDTDTDQAAIEWAQTMGQYAFNFPVGTRIAYDVFNMFRVDTTHSVALVNPYEAAGAPNAASMVAGRQTVLALLPHHYQPLTLGPDLTKAARSPVVWSPLTNPSPGKDFPVPASAPANANKNAGGESRWSYWSLRGNLKPIITSSFKTSYPFQNFLPVMPPPDWKKAYPVRSVQQVNVTNVGTGNRNVAPPAVRLVQPPPSGSGATFEAAAPQPDGSIPTIAVLTGGTGYPKGAVNLKVVIDPPPAGGEQATANVFVDEEGGPVSRIEVSNAGKGYTARPGVRLEPNPGSGAELTATVEPFTGRVQQVNVIKGGSGYPVSAPGQAATGVVVEIDPPTSPPVARGGIQATAQIQTGGNGEVLAVFMTNQGWGYGPSITIEQAGITDPPVIVPNFDGDGNLVLGPAQIINAGAGFDDTKPYTITINSTGTGATAEVVPTSVITRIEMSTVPGVGSPGLFPSSGDLVADAARLKVTVEPPAGGGAAQTAKVTGVVPSGAVHFVLTDSGSYGAVAPTAYFLDDTNARFDLGLNFTAGRVIGVFYNGTGTPPKVTTPKPIVFENADGQTRAAAGSVYGTFAVDPSKVLVDGATVSGYQRDVNVTITGGEIATATAEPPRFNLTFADGKLTGITLDPAHPGKGFFTGGNFRIEGNRGYDAVLQPYVNEGGSIIGVKVLQGGSGYLDQVYAVATPANGAEFDVTVENGTIKSVRVVKGGSGFSGPPPISLFSQPNGSDPIGQSPKGPFATVVYGNTPEGAVTSLNIAEPGANYFAGTGATATDQTPAANVVFTSPVPFAVADAAPKGFFGRVIPPSTTVEQAFYDTLAFQYTNAAEQNLAPFGGAFEGASAPDGYGLGNGLSANSRMLTDIYNLQQWIASPEGGGADVPSFAASDYVSLKVSESTGAYQYAQPDPANPGKFLDSAMQDNSPLFTLSGSLRQSVQAMQRTITRLFDSNLASNNPTDSQTWKMKYFSLYDAGAGRVVVNPTATVPAKGGISSRPNPPAPNDNAGKEGLAAWTPGALWTGFFVSDQWNDQHYFYGYYLSTAAIAGILDGAWLSDITGKPASLWAGPQQMGTGIDQWLMTLAYDPEIDGAYYKINNPAVTYQKFAFFDQWNGHAWATGLSPGPSYAAVNSVEDDPWGNWLVKGTGSSSYDGENENSIFEGMQAWSGAILWAGATDRKPIADLGIYLMATEMAAGDLYFLDKNYNLGIAHNQYSWAPVTTVDSAAVKNNGGNAGTPAGTDYVRTMQSAFWTAPSAFDADWATYQGQASAGNSIVKKVANSMDNFFFGIPVGSKLIQAFPPGPWTLAISRNTDYMRRWAGAWMRPEWKQLRESTLYSAPDWLAMAMTAALCGVPYNPGDTPYPLTPGEPVSLPVLPSYVDRLWDQWISRSGPAGANTPIKGFTTPSSVLSFLLSLDKYGTPDWTYIAQVTDGNGTEKGDTILYSATFSKVVGGAVQTTFVLFNPGWETRYAKFFRLGADGTPGATPASGDTPLTVNPKRMLIKQVSFPIE